MKRFLTTILTVIYLGTSAGATLHKHYCMGKLADWGLGHNNSPVCSQCGMEKSDNQCCRDEYKVIKNSDDQLITESDFQVCRQDNTSWPVSFFENRLPGSPFIITQNFSGHEPPRSEAIAVYLRNRVFRI